VVQIHSPRPTILQSATYAHANGRRAPGLGLGGRRSKLFRLDHYFASRFKNLRCVFKFRSCFVFTDNTDNIGGAKPKPTNFCLFQTECAIFFHLAIAISNCECARRG
jgi:hypothetical protein